MADKRRLRQLKWLEHSVNHLKELRGKGDVLFKQGLNEQLAWIARTMRRHAGRLSGPTTAAISEQAMQVLNKLNTVMGADELTASERDLEAEALRSVALVAGRSLNRLTANQKPPKARG